MRILFVVRGLHLGGAERQLSALARGLRGRGHDAAVAQAYGGGVFEEELRAAGVPIHDLRKRGRWDNARALARLEAIVRADAPDVVYGFMELGNLYASAMKLAFPRATVAWGIRTTMNGGPSSTLLGAASGLVLRGAAAAADVVIANSQAARRLAAANGVPPARLAVVPNGVDCDAFRPDAAAGAALRREWDLPEEAPVVGVVARLDPVKDHDTFLRAAARLAARRGDARFVVVGDGAPAYRARLERLAAELGLAPRLTWAGARKATRAVYSAFDATVLASDAGESFPNVLVESMACGTPCVATDSGDAAEIVGGAGAAVPRRDPEALAAAVSAVLARAPGDDLGARARALGLYSVERLVSRTEELLRTTRARTGGRARPRAVASLEPATGGSSPCAASPES